MLFISPNNEYPRHYGDIQLDYPNWKLGSDLPEGWVEVATAEKPAVNSDEIAYEDFPTEIDGVMTQNWAVRKMTAEEIERREAPKKAKEKLIELGFSEAEIRAIARGLF